VLAPSGTIERPGDPAIAWYELGGEGPTLLMVHATGFCAAVLAPMATRLTERFRCLGIDQRAHGASGRPADGDFSWDHFAEDVLAVVDRLGLERPLGFGHSSGAAALLLAEEAQPGTFTGLYCFEPVIYPGDIPPAPGLAANPLALGAQRRRRHFSGPDEALANFSAKAPLERLDPAALAAYVDSGFEPDRAGGIRLRCRPEDEAQIYSHGMSHDAYARLSLVRCPVTLACGERTDSLGPDLLELFAARLERAEQVVVPGVGHFGPLEDPAAVARSLTSSRAATSAGERAEGSG
jgi:pimeloyl-ACP methyl ester carboxylesterase